MPYSLRSEFHATQPQLDDWISRWISTGSAALEALIARHGDGFSFGATPTLAECCRAPQAVEAAHPDAQADADRP